MDLATAAICKLVPMLVDLLKDEYKLQKGLKEQVESLSRELEMAQAALSTLAEVPPERVDQRLLLWARDIRQASNDMIDILETFQVRGGMGKLFDLNLSKYKARRSIAVAIRGVMKQLKELTELRDRYTFDVMLGSRVPTSDPSNKDATQLVVVGNNNNMALKDDAAGYHQPIIERPQLLVRIQEPVQVRLEDMKNLGDWCVADKPSSLSVLSIVGSGGLGKTTMAMALYQKYCNLFESRAMVTISQNSDPDIVLGNILCQVRRRGGKGSNGKEDVATRQDKIEEIKFELQRHLETTRYLLFIDDVWSSSTWRIIKRYFPDNDRASRIIVTTRFHSVAMTCSSRHDTDDMVHQVQVLSDSDAKMLFHRTFSECSGTQDIRSSLNEIPDRVWEICGGLPIAIVTMAGLVASTQTTRGNNEWVKVCDLLFPEAEVCRKPEEFMRIINLCYHDLDSGLKNCALYLSIFPKGRKIGRKRLTRRWIAEGLVSAKQGLSVENVAEICFNQLITRKIIRPVEHCSHGLVKSCQVHDMVLEYLISKAAEVDFVTVVGSHWSMLTQSNKVNRLSVHGSDSKRAKHVDSMNLSHVRSLTVFDSLDKLNKLFKTGRVQVLDLEGCKGFRESHVKVSDICEMVLLKYLSLRRTDVKTLPQNIHKLKYLETIDIRETEVQQLPATVVKLQRIKNILGGDKRARKTLKLPRALKGAMRTLHTLSGVEIAEGSATAASDLHYFTELRKLAIYKIHKSEDIFKELLSSICYLNGYFLQTLKINDESSEFLKTLDSMSSHPPYLMTLELSGMLLKLPTWIDKLSKLVKLTLSATALRTDNLKILSNLGSLFSLTFSISEKHDPTLEEILQKNISESGGEIFFPAGGFSELKLLRIFVPLLPSLNFSGKVAPQLERIELCFKGLEGLHGLDKLLCLNDVLLTVDGKQCESTKSVLQNLEQLPSKYTLIIKETHY